MIEERLWVVRLVRMIFSAGGYSKRVQITSDLHPFFSAEREALSLELSQTIKSYQSIVI